MSPILNRTRPIAGATRPTDAAPARPDTRPERPTALDQLAGSAPIRTGALPTGAPATGATLDARITARPRTIAQPRLQPTLERGGISLADRGEGRTYDARVSIPLSALDTAPMTPAEFIDHIKSVELPAVWAGRGERPVAFEVIGEGANARLVLDVETDHPSAWHQAAPNFSVITKDNQHVVIEPRTEAILLDRTASTRANLADRVEAAEQHIEFIRGSIAQWRAAAQRLGAPSSDTQVQLDRLDAEATELEGQIADRKSTLTAGWSELSPLDKLGAYSALRSLTGASRAVVSELNDLVDQLVTAHNRSIRAPASARTDEQLLAALDRELAVAEAGFDPDAVTTLRAHREGLVANIEAAEREAASGASQRDAVLGRLETFVRDHGLGDARLVASEFTQLGALPRGERLFDLERRLTGLTIRREVTAEVSNANRSRGRSRYEGAVRSYEADLAAETARLASLRAQLDAPAAPTHRWIDADHLD